MSYDEHLISMAGGDGEPDALDLDAIQARADAATEGPWDFDGGVVQSYELAVRTGEYTLERVGIIPDEYVRDNDAEFIAHARTDVPALLALAREQQARIERVRGLHRPVTQDFITAADCLREACECEDYCPTEPLPVCLHCWSQLEQIDPYFGEDHSVSEVMWPCPTFAVLTATEEP